MTKKFFALIAVFLFLYIPVCHADTSDVGDEIQAEDMMQKQYGIDCNAPFVKNNSNEYVDELTGAAVVRETDLVLPGKNGLDLPIIRKFNSQSYYGMYVLAYTNISSNFTSGVYYKYYTQIDGVKTYYDVWFPSETNMVENAFESFKTASSRLGSLTEVRYSSITVENGDITLFREKSVPARYTIMQKSGYIYIPIPKNKKNLSQHWELVIPHISWTFRSAEENEEETIRSAFQNEYGESFLFEYVVNNNIKSNGHFLESDRFSIEFADNETHSNGFTYNQKVIDRDGKTYYFRDEDILAIEDKFGNLIRYNQNGNDYPSQINITDSYGRQIVGKVNYDEYNATDCYIYVEEGDLAYHIDYEFAKENNPQLDPYNNLKFDDIYTMSVTKSKLFDGEVTDSETTVYHSSRKEGEDDFPGLNIDSYTLDEIEYPSGYTVEYDYEKCRKIFLYYDADEFSFMSNWQKTIMLGNVERNIYNNSYKVTSRKEYENGELVCSDNYQYVYNYQEGTPIKFLSVNNTSVTTVTNQQTGMITEITFDGYGRRKKQIKDEDYSEYIMEYRYTDNETDSPEKKRAKPMNQIKKISYRGIITINFQYDSDNTIYYQSDGTRTKTNIRNIHGVPAKSASSRDSKHTTVLITNAFGPDNLDANIVTWQKLAEEVKLESGETVTNEYATTYFQYDEYGNITQERTEYDQTHSVTTNYNYDYKTNKELEVTKTVLNVEDPEGVSTQVVTKEYYDFLGNLISVTDANGNITTMEYDVNNRLVRQENPDGTVKTNVYDIANNSVTVTDENGNSMKYDFTPRGQLQAVYDINGTTPILLEEHGYDALGRHTLFTQWRTDTDYTKSEYTYDALGNKTDEEVTDSNDETVLKNSYLYMGEEENGRDVTSILTFLKDDILMEESLYDVYGNLVSIRSIDQHVAPRFSTYEYDNWNNLISETSAVANSQNSGPTMQYEYDYNGNLIKQTNALGDISTAEYDSLGRKISETDYEGNTAQYSYDVLGRNILKTAPFDGTNSAETKTYYDGNGNVLKTKTLSNVPGQQETYDQTEYVYDTRNRMIATKTVVDDNNSLYTQYAYDGVGNVTKMVTGLTELTDISTDNLPEGASAIKYTYTPQNRLETMTDAMGNITRYEYDRAGNVTKEYYNGEERYSNTYTALNQLETTTAQGDATQMIQREYDGKGNITRIQQGNKAIDYTYDDYNELISEEFDGIRVEYEYNKNKMVTKQTSYASYNSVGTELTYTYDAMDRVTQIAAGGNITNYAYNRNGSLISETTGERQITRTYNQAGMPISITNMNDETVVSQETAAYKLDGNKYSASNENGIYTYAYDGAGRLTNAVIADKTYSYTYDNRNNRIGQSVTQNGQSTSTSYTYNLNNQLLHEEENNGIMKEITDYTYDPKGNLYSKLKSRTGITDGNPQAGLSTDTSDMALYTYDGFDHLTEVMENGKTATYTYDGTGMRRSKTVDGNTTRFILSGGNVIGEAEGNTVRNYVHGVSGVAYELNGSNITHYYYKNIHGDVTATEDGNGGYIRYTYSPFGEVTSTAQMDTNPFRYCGEYYDNETGNIYLRNRYYSPNVGRFTQIDPIMDGLNWYVYCGNNPVNRIDPSGTDDGNFLDIAVKATWLAGAQYFLQDEKGWYLTATLLELSVLGEENSFVAHNGEYAAELVKNDTGLRNEINDTIWKYGTSQNNNYIFFMMHYEFTTSGGDLGAAIHMATVSVTAERMSDGSWSAYIEVDDVFDFTKFTNPFSYEDNNDKFLWFMNDLAYLDQREGLINPVNVHIDYADVF